MDVTIKHKAGRENSNADALSRNPVNVSLVCAVAADSDQSLPPDVAALHEEQKDPELAAMLHYLQDSTQTKSRPNEYLQRASSTTLLMTYFILRTVLFRIVGASLCLNIYVLKSCEKLMLVVLQHTLLNRKCMTTYVKMFGGKG